MTKHIYNYKVIVTEDTFTIIGMFSLSIIKQRCSFIYSKGAMQFDMIKVSQPKTFLIIQGKENDEIIFFSEKITIYEKPEIIFSTFKAILDIYLPTVIYNDFEKFLRNAI
jgi:hypothetical protein